jgi:hypothetical protein
MFSKRPTTTRLYENPIFAGEFQTRFGRAVIGGAGRCQGELPVSTTARRLMSALVHLGEELSRLTSLTAHVSCLD